MIIRLIKLQAWKCFEESVEVGPFGEKLNVVFAPNASGKSTLLDALIRGLFDGHRVSGTEVESIRPWGRALAPTVTVEFSHGGVDYRLEKRFLDQPHAELRRKENSRFAAYAEGDAADEKVREMLSASAPGRGLSRPDNFGLAQVLWAPQGALEFSDLSSGLVARIRDSLGTQIVGPGASPLEDKIEEVFASIFTTKGRLKTGKQAPRIVAIEKEFDDARDRFEEARASLVEFEEASRRVEDLKLERNQAKEDQEALEKEREHAESEAQRYAKLEAKRAKLEEEVKLAEAQHNGLQERIDSIKVKKQKLAGEKEKLKDLGGGIEAQEEEVGRLKTQEAKASKQLEDTKKDRAKVEDALTLANQAGDYVRAREESQRLQDQIEKLDEVSGELGEAKRELAKLVAPDQPTLKQIKKAVDARGKAKIELDASSITVEVIPEKDVTLEVVEAEHVGKLEITAGEPAEIKGAPQVVLDLEGIARIRSRGPLGSIDELKKRVSERTQEIRTLTSGFGTEDIEKLESLCQRRTALEKEISNSESRLSDILGSNAREEIELELGKAQQTLAQVASEHEEWEKEPPDHLALRREHEKLNHDFIARIDEAEGDKENTVNMLQAAKDELGDLRANLGSTQASIESLDADISDLQNDGLDDQEREEKRRQFSLKWRSASDELEEVRVELAEFGDDPSKDAERLKAQLKEARDRETRSLGNEKIEEGKLKKLAERGPYATLTQAEERVTELEEEHGRELLMTKAVKLLRDTVDECRRDAVAAVSGPVEDVATRMLSRIAGGKLGRIKLAEGFLPEEVNPIPAEDEVSVKRLSGGEREQIHFAVRLALAEVLSGEERQLVVLDDVLTATDVPRMSRILSILEESARNLQILILTCHPERYRSMREVVFFNLEELARR